MATYVPIIHSQGVITRSAIKSTSREKEKTPATDISSSKSKTNWGFHMPKMKNDFIIIQRISRFKFSKLGSSNTHETPVIKNQLAAIASVGPVTPVSHITKERQMIKCRDNNFQTPLNQIKPVLQSQQTKFSSLLAASFSPEASLYKEQFRAEGYISGPDGRIIEEFVNNMLATLAAMYPRSAFELLSMRNKLLSDLTKIQASKEDNKVQSKKRNKFRELKLKSHLDERFGILKRHIDLNNDIPPAIERGVNDAEGTELLFKEAIKSSREHTIPINAEGKNKIDKMPTERRKNIELGRLTSPQ
ncbi:BgTH12-05882 [Blumeria graminis f. sp. triticale]|uniref:BgTH12-05882 n=1 Tax=Blumeria graminis f. sp. triticale TaxID=1689686 RepID=A0A9W4D3N9_BLUGR|nr:BgTH12-05882 [Blumeria graminis f. sp. triticale]